MRDFMRVSLISALLLPFAASCPGGGGVGAGDPCISTGDCPAGLDCKASPGEPTGVCTEREPASFVCSVDCEADDDYCDDQLNSCGTDSAAQHICASTVSPGDCTDVGSDRVCGCDGQVYENPTCAQQVGADLSFAGGCTPPAGTFACAQSFCDPTMRWCSIREAPISLCEVLPAACTAGGATPTCDCLPVKCPPGYTEASCDDTQGEITVNCTPN